MGLTEHEIGRGEERAFKIQSYKNELLPLWSIKTLPEARTTAEAIFERFEESRAAEEFVGTDIAPK
jgi:hypothetical protein